MKAILCPHGIKPKRNCRKCCSGWANRSKKKHTKRALGIPLLKPGTKLILCEHGVLGKRHCKKCKAIIQRRHDQKPEVRERHRAYSKWYAKTPQGKIRAKRWNDANKDKRRQSNKKHRLKIKMIVISYYSNGTMECALHHKYFPEENPKVDVRCLSIDHVDGGGARLRRRSERNKNGEWQKHSGNHLYAMLIKNNFPLGYQVLCMNCQIIKALENNEYRKDNAFYENFYKHDCSDLELNQDR